MVQNRFGPETVTWTRPASRRTIGHHNCSRHWIKQPSREAGNTAQVDACVVII